MTNLLKPINRQRPLRSIKATVEHWGLTPIFLLLLLAPLGCRPMEPSGQDGDSTAKTEQPSKVEDTIAEPAAPTPISPAELTQLALDGNLPKILLAAEKGTDLNAIDEEGRTALMMAAFNGHTRVVQYLVEHKVDINVRDSNGRTALMYASTIDNAELVKILLDQGAEVNLADNVEGFTALMFAAGEGHTQVMEVLLAAGADRNVKDIDGDTALEFATRTGHQAAAQLLSE